MHEEDTHSFSIVVTVYNGEDSIGELVRQIGECVPRLGGPFEVILVNDHSRDRSWEIVERLAAEHDWVRGIDFARNYGQHSALLAGIRAARYEIVVTMDDDLEHPPSEIGLLVDKLDEGYDVVYGTPERQQHGLLRDAAAALTKLTLTDSLGSGAARNISSFRAFRTRLRDGFARVDGPYVFVDALLSWSTSRFGHVRVRHEPRRSGTSNYTLRRLIVHALTVVTSFCVWPLRVAFVLGAVMALVGGAVGVAALVTASSAYVVAMAVLLAAGTLLFAIGVGGEYLARVHFRLMGKPAYVVRETTGDAGAGDVAGRTVAAREER